MTDAEKAQQERDRKTADRFVDGMLQRMGGYRRAPDMMRNQMRVSVMVLLANDRADAFQRSPAIIDGHRTLAAQGHPGAVHRLDAIAKMKKAVLAVPGGERFTDSYPEPFIDAVIEATLATLTIWAAGHPHVATAGIEGPRRSAMWSDVDSGGMPIDRDAIAAAAREKLWASKPTMRDVRVKAPRPGEPTARQLEVGDRVELPDNIHTATVVAVAVRREAAYVGIDSSGFGWYPLERLLILSADTERSVR